MKKEGTVSKNYSELRALSNGDGLNG